MPAPKEETTYNMERHYAIAPWEAPLPRLAILSARKKVKTLQETGCENESR